MTKTVRSTNEVDVKAVHDEACLMASKLTDFQLNSLINEMLDEMKVKKLKGVSLAVIKTRVSALAEQWLRRQTNPDKKLS
jgi:hypothetical protein